MRGDPLLDAIDVTAGALEENSRCRWIVGFSGGKDSTAALKILLSACTRITCEPPPIDIIYCDTGVENPVLDKYVKSLFARLDGELAVELPFVSTRILQAPVEQRFFVKIVGRGYPPPTNNFRWCTKFLRIRPVAEFVKQAAVDDAIVVLGMRRSESQQRDRSLASSDGYFQDQREGNKSYRLFLPILDLGVPEVWDAVFSLTRPKSVRPHDLELLYRGASGECPVIKAPQAAPCASGRFGCWTCTVVRKDKSALSLIQAGHSDLVPFHDFRNWLAEFRNDTSRRWKRRRNGSHGAGAFNLQARREIFDRLRELERQTRTTIMATDEIAEIERLWELDRDIDAEMDTAA